MSGQTAQALAEEGGHHDVARFLSERTKALKGANSDPFAEYQEHRLHSAEVCYNLMTTTVQHSTDGTWLDSPIEVKLKKKKWNSRSFLQTLKQWSRLNHPHIVKLYGFCHSDDTSKDPISCARVMKDWADHTAIGTSSIKQLWVCSIYMTGILSMERLAATVSLSILVEL